jgi:ABC-2 type transport system ATP-binding protein
MNDTASIQLQDLRKAYGPVQAVKGISQTIESGQIYGLLGPNGAGKTTLIRLLIGSIKPTAGQISVFGLDPIKQKRALRRMIGYMPQTPALYEDLTARENIRFFGQAHTEGGQAEKVEEVIEFVGLQERANDQVYKFSGGMKQRVSLACALVHQPKLLFLDEPTSGIDPKLRETFWKHFHRLTANGTTIIISTHQMDEAINCTRLAVLHLGVVLAEDTPRNLLADTRARITVQRGENQRQYQVDNYRRQLPEVLREYGLESAVTRIEVEEETLETVVLEMINRHEAHTSQEDGNEGNI